MINYETVLSSFDDKMTLMQWLQKVEEALQGAGLVSVTVTQNTPTTCVLKFNFADGSSVTSASISLPKGDKGDKGDKGNTGDTGNGISSISKTGTSGLVDTYTITYTNGNTQTFTVTNGAKGDTGKSVSSISVSTFTGEITINYTDGSTQADAGHMFYVVKLTGASGTLTDTQYNYLVAGYPNIYIQHGDYLFTLANISPTSRQYICIDIANNLYQTITVATQTKGWTYQSGQHIVLDVEGDSSSLTMGGVLSTGATLGQVLTADGDGGASWQTASGGTTLNKYQITNLNLLTSANLQRFDNILKNAKGNIYGNFYIFIDGDGRNLSLSQLAQASDSVQLRIGGTYLDNWNTPTKLYVYAIRIYNGAVSGSAKYIKLDDNSINNCTIGASATVNLTYYNDTEILS